MKILLAARSFDGIGGSQTWCQTVTAELERRGHVVRRYAADRGTYEIPWPHSPGFDLGIFAHGTETSAGFGLCDRTILVSHGIIEHERPVPGADAYAFVSEECQDFWGGPGAWQPSRVVRQPIDCSFWKERHLPVPEKFRVGPYVLRFSYYGGLPWLGDVCRELGYDCRHVKDDDPETAREWIRGAVVVISSGRGALEAMACGVPTVICDDRPYNGGPMLDTGIGVTTSYSGRGGTEATPENVRAAIERSLKDKHGISPRLIVHAYNHAPMIVDQLLELGAG